MMRSETNGPNNFKTERVRRVKTSTIKTSVKRESASVQTCRAPMKFTHQLYDANTRGFCFLCVVVPVIGLSAR